MTGRGALWSRHPEVALGRHGLLEGWNVLLSQPGLSTACRCRLIFWRGRQRRVLIHRAEECLHYVIVAETYSDLAQLTGRLALTCTGRAAGADSADLLPIVGTCAEGRSRRSSLREPGALPGKLGIRAAAAATGIGTSQVVALVRWAGDLRQTAEQLLAAAA